MNEQDEVLAIFGENNLGNDTYTLRQPATVKMITEKQIDLINKLWVQKGLFGPATVVGNRAYKLVTDKLVTEATRLEASKTIDWLISLKSYNTVAKPVAKKDYWGDRNVPDIAGKVPAQGIFTVVFPDAGHRTIRFSTAKNGGWAGKTVVQYLCGADNDSDYKAVGHAVEGGIKVWANYKGTKHSLVLEAIKSLLGTNEESRIKAGEAYAVASGRCWNCNRTLTVPASLWRGLGPVCADKLGY